MSSRNVGVWAAVVVLGGIVTAAAGAQVTSPATADLQKAQAGATAAATPGAAPANPFPPVNLKNFTASSPSREEVDSFLKVLWGYEENRIWSVAAILNTPAPGVSRVVVLVGDKTQPGKVGQIAMYITPDGKHAIADSVIDFGPKPFAATRRRLQDEATGPAHGAASKDLELVEFTDLQCAKCKEAEDTMDRLGQDFPQARIVYQSFPVTEGHPYALRSAEIGACIRKAKGDAAFFTYANEVYAHQAALTAANANDTLEAATKAAGADPKAMGVCADGQAAKDEITASTKLGTDVGVSGTPILMANGRSLPLTTVPYEVLKRIVAFQAGQDGVAVHLQPSLNTLK